MQNFGDLTRTFVEEFRGPGMDDQQTVNAAFAEVSGREMVFQPGRTYTLTDQIQLVSESQFKIEGNHAKLLMAAGTATLPGFGYSALAMTGCTDFEVEDLETDGNRDNRPAVPTSGGSDSGAHLWYFLDCKRFTVRRCTANNSPSDGFYCGSTDQASLALHPVACVYEDCIADNAGRNGLAIIHGIACGVVRGQYTNTNGRSPECGANIETGQSAPDGVVTACYIDGVYCEGNAAFGITLSGASQTRGCVLRNSVVNNNGAGGVSAGGTCAVLNNYFADYTASVVRSIVDIPADPNAHGVQVHSNRFEDNQGIGSLTQKTCVYVHSAAGPASILGNTALDSPRFCSAQSQGSVIANNVIMRPTDNGSIVVLGDYCQVVNNYMDMDGQSLGIWLLPAIESLAQGNTIRNIDPTNQGSQPGIQSDNGNARILDNYIHGLTAGLAIRLLSTGDLLRDNKFAAPLT